MANSAEIYGWHTLPFCGASSAAVVEGGFGDALSGDRKVATPYKLNWMKDEEMVTLCKRTLSEDDIVRGVGGAGVGTRCGEAPPLTPLPPPFPPPSPFPGPPVHRH